MPPILLDHIAIALPRIADAPAALVGVLGGLPDKSWPSGAFRWATWTFAAAAAIEILEPMGTDGFLHRFLAAHGRGVHHVTFRVPDLAEACRRAEAAGYDIVGRDESNRSWKEAFLHPKQALGIVVQLAESEIAPPPARPASVSPGLPDPPPPARILGLRLRAQSRARAITQWRDVLHGRDVRAPGRQPRLPLAGLADAARRRHRPNRRRGASRPRGGCRAAHRRARDGGGRPRHSAPTALLLNAGRTKEAIDGIRSE